MLDGKSSLEAQNMGDLRSAACCLDSQVAAKSNLWHPQLSALMVAAYRFPGTDATYNVSLSSSALLQLAMVRCQHWLAGNLLTASLSEAAAHSERLRATKAAVCVPCQAVACTD